MFKVSKVDACILVVIACVMIDLLGLSLTIPILANYARDVQGQPEGCPLQSLSKTNASLYDTMYHSSKCQESLALIKANTGFLTTAYSFAMLISTFWMPRFSDKFGPRLAIIVSLFGSLIGFLGQALTCPSLETSPNSECVGIPGGFGLLVGVRALGGLFGGTATVAAVFIVLLYPQKERGKQFAKMSVGALSAFVFGPFVGGGLAQFGLRVPLYAAAGLSALAMVAAFYFVTDPNELAKTLKKGKDENDKKEEKKEEAAVDPNFKPWKSIRVYIISAQTMFTTLAFNGLSSLMALVLLEERLGVVLPTDTVEIQGRKVALWVMAFVPALGGSQVVVLMALFPRAIKKLGLLSTGAVGSIFMAIGLMLIPFYPHPAYVFITQVLLAIGNGLQTNVSNTYLSKFAPKGHAAQVLSYGTMADTIGNIIGPQLTQIYLVNSQLPFFIAASFGICSMVCCLVLKAMGNHEHDDHKKDDALLKNGENSSTNATESKSVELAEKKSDSDAFAHLKGVKDDLKVDLDLESQPLVQLIHPACHRSLGKGIRGTGELADEDQIKFTTAAYQQLTTKWYNDLKEKNHLYGLRSKISIIRNRSVAAHEDWFVKEMPTFPDPDDETEDKEFKEAVAVFLDDAGHHDWALQVPGVDLENVLKNFQVPM